MLVTGGAGFIGSALVRRLLDDGYEVRVIDDLSKGLRENIDSRAEFWWTDIGGMPDSTNGRVFDMAFEGVDRVFHAAAISSLPECQSDPGRAYAVNVAGTARVLEAARQAGVSRVVFSSSGAVYENETEDFPSRECVSVRPTLVYPSTKLHAEGVCRSFVDAYGLDVISLRYFNVYGPGQDSRRTSPPFTSYVVRELLAGRAPVLHSDGTQSRDYVYVDDVVAANLAASDCAPCPGSVFNVCSGKAHSVNELYRLIAAACGSRLEPEFRPTDAFWQAYPSIGSGPFPLKSSVIECEVGKFTLGDPSSISAAMGWSPTVGIEEGIRRLVGSVRSPC